MRKVRKNNLPFRLFSVALLLLAVGGRAAESPGHVRFQVSGLGWQDDRLARDTLVALLGDKPRATLDANVIEDAALILFSQETDDGYLKAEIIADAKLADGSSAAYPLDARLDHPLPRPLEATAVTLRVVKGRRFVLREIAFTGLHTLPEDRARTFFVGESLLIALDSDRVYSPNRLARSAANLQTELQQRGYAEAEVHTDQLQVNEETGDTRVRVVVSEGPRWQVKAVKLDVAGGGEAPPDFATGRVDRPWSPHWRQNCLTSARNWYYERGYPDVQVKVNPAAAAPADGQRAVTVTVAVVPGPRVRVGQIKFSGSRHTREPVLRRLVPAHTGDLLDPAKFDDGLSRLSRLGVFSHIALAYEPPEGEVRDALYELTEGRRQELSLLAGWGSYEQLRGGIEWRHFNLFGRAHSDDLQLIQSMKSTQGSYTYTVPELFGTTVDGSARLFGLRREELAFEREEYGASVSLSWPLTRLGASLTTGYTYQNLNSADNELATRNFDEANVKSASIDIGLVKDKRDNPLQPHRGYKVALRVEAAAKTLGGEVNYQQAILSGSWHTRMGRGRWFHIGLAQAVVTTLGAPEGSQPPVNVLFYPGGDGSIRGYQKDEAAPRNPVTGEFVGAKTYTQLNVEIEQALTRKWTIVGFFDAIGTATRLADYPWSEKLYSAGLGIRYQTVIGPIRLEYGHNLNPRPYDPSGTVLFSIGYPF